jgi:hypothetical protein
MISSDSEELRDCVSAQMCRRSLRFTAFNQSDPKSFSVIYPQLQTHSQSAAVFNKTPKIAHVVGRGILRKPTQVIHVYQTVYGH